GDQGEEHGPVWRRSAAAGGHGDDAVERHQVAAAPASRLQRSEEHSMRLSFTIGALVLLLLTSLVAAQSTQPLSREEWGAPPVSVTHDGDTWTLAGKKQTVMLGAKDLEIRIRAVGGAEWS